MIIAFIQHSISQKTGSTMVTVDAQNWLINGVISLAVGIAFTIVTFLKDSSFAWWVPYSDSTIVIVVVLLSIGVPVQIVIQNIKQLLLAAPSSKIQREIKEFLTEAIQKLPCEQCHIRMTETAQYIYIYLLWLLPQSQESKKVQEIDRYRNTLIKKLQEYSENINIDIIFTEDKDWFETRI